MSKDTEEILEAKVMWYPDSKKNTQMDRFRAHINRAFAVSLANYNDLYQWSVENYPEFWAEVFKFCGITCSHMYEEVVDHTKRVSDVPEWFRGCRMNYAENLLKHKDQDKVALYSATEAREEITKVTFGELRRHVALYAAALRKMGIKTGDRVVGHKCTTKPPKSWPDNAFTFLFRPPPCLLQQAQSTPLPTLVLNEGRRPLLSTPGCASGGFRQSSTETHPRVLEVPAASPEALRVSLLLFPPALPGVAEVLRSRAPKAWGAPRPLQGGASKLCTRGPQRNQGGRPQMVWGRRKPSSSPPGCPGRVATPATSDIMKARNAPAVDQHLPGAEAGRCANRALKSASLGGVSAVPPLIYTMFDMWPDAICASLFASVHCLEETNDLSIETPTSFCRFLVPYLVFRINTHIINLWHFGTIYELDRIGKIKKYKSEAKIDLKCKRPNGVLDRFSQIQPKLIFSVSSVVYNGKEHDHMEKLKNVVKGLPDLEGVVVIPYVRTREETDISKIPNSMFLEQFLALGKEGDQDPQLEFEQLPFCHPLFIMYSSGTTGAPKCMVHSAGGTLIQHLKEHILHGNMTSSDVIIYYTTTGWMMWNWLISSLATGASVVLYDGSPLMPSPNVLWDLVDRLGITIFGTGAKWLSVLEERNLKPSETHNLQTLHTILSTGSTLKPQSYDYVYKHIKSNVLLGSISGGTDIISCFMGQNFTVPVYRGEIQARNLGMGVEAWSCEGKPVWGESGELVCTKPMPCQPTHFWNDDNGSKYHKAYFSSFPGFWAHGDYCKINPQTGGIVMLGRSDGTLNPNGVRFGSSEIYNIVEAFEEVSDSLCIPQYNKDGEERVILFLKMGPKQIFSQDLVGKIRTAIRVALSARHVPALILETKDIPYTISGKKVEVAVKQIVAGKEVTQRSAFSNPDSLDLYKNIPELQNF
ncbi:AACS synthetase, partial [Polypterus senegalus]